MNLKDFFGGDSVVWILWALAIVIGLLIVFEVGVAVGFHRARYAFDSGSYPLMGGHMPHVLFGEGPGGNGAIGTISSVTLPQVTITGRDGQSQIVLISTTTVIRDDETNGTSTDAAALKDGESVVVIGEPAQNGAINARLVRITAAETNAPMPPNQ